MNNINNTEQICSTKQAKRFLINKLKILPSRQLMFHVVTYMISVITMPMSE
jgi:hypothetical protein